MKNILISIEEIKRLTLESKNAGVVLLIPTTAIARIEVSKPKIDKIRTDKENNYEYRHCKEAYVELFRNELEESIIEKLFQPRTKLSIIGITFNDGSIMIYQTRQASNCEEYYDVDDRIEKIALQFKRLDYYE